ncbi:unnamed protein product [Meloidogyne enterolobii]|uniref:Uncharacterized protein n=1 Tax=Meloidogyne enterolobii TaxID=390850 RepID=A0ACB0ZHZ0_MELEN
MKASLQIIIMKVERSYQTMGKILLILTIIIMVIQVLHLIHCLYAKKNV